MLLNRLLRRSVVNVNEELTFFKRLQIVGVLHAFLALIFFIIEGFEGILIIDWWIRSDMAKIAVTIFFWVIAPKVVDFLRLKV